MNDYLKTHQNKLLTKQLSLLFALLSLPLLSGFSQMVQADETDAPRYQLEMIIFETTALRGWTEEYWPMLEDISTDDSTTEETDTDTPPPFHPTPLAKKSFLLKSEANKMTPNKGYHILTHQAWILKGLPENKAHVIQLENYPQNQYQTHLTGQLFFYKSHYNHIDLTLNFEKRIPKKIRAKFAKNEQIDLANLPDTWQFDLQASRKIRPNNLYYIDHPIFGVLVKIKYLPQ